MDFRSAKVFLSHATKAIVLSTMTGENTLFFLLNEKRCMDWVEAFNIAKFFVSSI